MTGAEQPAYDTEHSSCLGRSAVKLNGRRARRQCQDINIRKADFSAKACSERLQHRLLGGETPGEAMQSIWSVASGSSFVLGKAPCKEVTRWIVRQTPHLFNVYQIDPVPNDIHVFPQTCSFDSSLSDESP